MLNPVIYDKDILHTYIHTKESVKTLHKLLQRFDPYIVATTIVYSPAKGGPSIMNREDNRYIAPIALCRFSRPTISPTIIASSDPKEPSKKP